MGQFHWLRNLLYRVLDCMHSKNLLPSFKHSIYFRSLYRNVSIVKPDLTALLKAKCTALGLRSPKSLADRLRCLAELSYQQIPRPTGQHHEVSLQAIIASLISAALKRKARVYIQIIKSSCAYTKNIYSSWAGWAVGCHVTVWHSGGIKERNGREIIPF